MSLAEEPPMATGPAKARTADKPDPDNDSIQPHECAQRLSALAAPDRLLIVRFLGDGPHNVTEIAAHLRTSAVNLAHHLAVLKHAGIVRDRKQGRFVYYELVPGFLQESADQRKQFLDLGCCRLEV